MNSLASALGVGLRRGLMGIMLITVKITTLMGLTIVLMSVMSILSALAST